MPSDASLERAQEFLKYKRGAQWFHPEDVRPLAALLDEVRQEQHEATANYCADMCREAYMESSAIECERIAAAEPPTKENDAHDS